MTVYTMLVCPITKSQDGATSPYPEGLTRYTILAESSSAALQRAAAALKQRCIDKPELVPEGHVGVAMEVLQFERGISDADNDNTVILK